MSHFVQSRAPWRTRDLDPACSTICHRHGDTRQPDLTPLCAPTRAAQPSSARQEQHASENLPLCAVVCAVVHTCLPCSSPVKSVVDSRLFHSPSTALPNLKRSPTLSPLSLCRLRLGS